MSRAPIRFEYEKDPKAIYRQSFEMIKDALGEDNIPIDVGPVAQRLIHACGMTDIVNNLFYSNRAGEIGRDALQAGASILCDSEMVSAGIIRNILPAENNVVCTLNDPPTPALAKKIMTTRSAAALNLWLPHLEGSIVAIGNAPTALFRLMEMISDGAPRPALILGFPVGFVGAAESKQALVDHAGTLEISFITLKGRRGGSAMASAAVNAIAGGNK